LDKRRFDVLFQRFCAIARSVEPMTAANITMNGMWYGPRGFFLLRPEAAIPYQQFVTDVLREADWDQKFSREYLRSQLRPLLEEFILTGEPSAKTGLQALFDHLSAFNDAQTVYLPILGLNLDDAPRRDIAGVVLHRATDEFLNTIVIPDTLDYIKRQTETRVWAEVTIIAETHRAATRAEERCHPLIDVLRFWMACMTPPGTPCAIGLQGDIVTAERPRIITKPNGPTYDPHRSRLIPGFPLCDHTMTVLQSVHVDVLADLITTPQQSKFVKLLLHALHVFGNATAAALHPDRFMNLMMTLEAFLTVGDAPINQSVAEGVVIFLAVPVAERVRLKNELQRLYRLRSKIAHGDQTTVPPDQLCLLEDLTKTFLVAMIQHRNQFASKQAFLDALEERRLS